MPWMNVAGYGDLNVTEAEELTPTVIGETTRAFAGNARTHHIADKRVWRFGLLDMDKTAHEALLTAVRGQHVQVSGDALPGTFDAIVRHSGSAYVHRGTAHELVPTIEVEEV